MFKSDSGRTAAEPDDHSTTVLAAAGAVTPVGELNAINRAALCKTASVVHVQRNDQLKPENSHRWLMYLVDGSLSLYSGNKEVGTINARTPEALKPLFEDKNAYQSARTTAMAKIVRFGREQLNILLREQQKAAINVMEVQVGELDNLIFDDVAAALAENTITLAVNESNAARILSSYNNVAGIPELAEVIQCDAGLTAHLVNAANRIDGTAGDTTSTIRGAITRLGVKETKRTVKALLQTNTLKPSSEVIDKRMRRYTQRTGLCTALVQVLAKELPHLKPEVAMLVALASDLGELLIISYANNHPDRFVEESDLGQVIYNLRSILSTWLIDSWNFPQEFVDACQKSRDWYRNHNGEITYTDLVTAALLIIQSELPDSQNSSIPSSDNLLLARKLQQAGIDLTSPGDILKAASSRLVSVESLLKAS